MALGFVVVHIPHDPQCFAKNEKECNAHKSNLTKDFKQNDTQTLGLLTSDYNLHFFLYFWSTVWYDSCYCLVFYACKSSAAYRLFTRYMYVPSYGPDHMFSFLIFVINILFLLFTCLCGPEIFQIRFLDLFILFSIIFFIT